MRANEIMTTSDGGEEFSRVYPWRIFIFSKMGDINAAVVRRKSPGDHLC